MGTTVFPQTSGAEEKNRGIDDASPSSFVQDMSQLGSVGSHDGSGSQTSRTPPKEARFRSLSSDGFRSHRRSFSAEDQRQFLMAQQQVQMMAQPRANTVPLHRARANSAEAPGVAEQLRIQNQQMQTMQQPSQATGPPARMRTESSGSGSGSSTGGRHSSRQRSRKRGQVRHRNRPRAYSADVDIMAQQLVIQEQQMQMQAMQQRMYQMQQMMQQQRQQQAGYSSRPPTSTISASPGMPPRTPTKPPSPQESSPIASSPSTADYVTPPSKEKRSHLEPFLNVPPVVDLFGAASPLRYGSMDSRASLRPPSPSSSPKQGGPIPPQTTEGFSPRQELLALAGAGGQSRRQSTQPKSLSPQLSPVTHRRSLSWGAPTAGYPPAGHLTPLRDPRTNLSEDIQAQLLSQSPSFAAPAQDGGGGRGVYSVPHDDASPSGERESFFPRHHKNHHHQMSLRKMHMRQQSIDLFMGNARGTQQTRRCRDVFFAALFYLHIAAMFSIGMKYGREALRPGAAIFLGDRTEELYDTYDNIILVASMCGAFAVLTSGLALFVMMFISRSLVQVCLIFSIGMSFAWGTIGIGLSPKSFVPITGIIALALSIGYTFVVYDRIPFATSNLRTALDGIRSNLGVVAVAFFFQFLLLVLIIAFAFAGVGLFDAMVFGDVNLGGRAQIVVSVGIALAYYWTYQVLVHVVQATVSGVIANWWFKPHGSTTPFCSEALTASIVRSTLFSFGSICYGSLLVGFVQTLRQFAGPIRPSSEESVLLCLHECLVCFQECIVSCVDGLSDTFNPWAFTYVGMYSYGFLEAGRRSTDLFRRRGWSMIVTDDLIPNVLFMVSVVIGGVTGCFAVLVQPLDEFRFYSIERPNLAAFLLGIAIGIVLSSVLLGLISSAVNAVVVCFAGSPVDFQKNHPKLSHEMRSAWREVWPGCMDIMDINVSMDV